MQKSVDIKQYILLFLDLKILCYSLILYNLPVVVTEKIIVEIKKMTHAGSSFNWLIGYGIAHAVVTEAGLGNLIGNEKGQITLSTPWLYKIMHSGNLVPRIGGHDAQTLPVNWEELAKHIF